MGLYIANGTPFPVQLLIITIFTNTKAFAETFLTVNKIFSKGIRMVTLIVKNFFMN